MSDTDTPPSPRADLERGLVDGTRRAKARTDVLLDRIDALLNASDESDST